MLAKSGAAPGPGSSVVRGLTVRGLIQLGAPRAQGRIHLVAQEEFMASVDAKRRWLSLVLLAFLVACSGRTAPVAQPALPASPAAQNAATTSEPSTHPTTPSIDLDQLAKSAAFLDTLYATLWMQTAEERRGLALQAYLHAHDSLSLALADPQWTAALEQQPGYENLPPAIIVDIDETVLDNTPSQSRVIRQGVRWNKKDWEAWVHEARAEAIPGAVELLDEAAARGVMVFYLSNRASHLAEPTRKNLLARGFPVAEGSLLLKGPEDSSDKGPRRRQVAERYRIILLAGDDFGDFTSQAREPLANRDAAGRLYANRWGRQWILLPNPIYGSWRDTLTDFGPTDERLDLERLFDQLRN